MLQNKYDGIPDAALYTENETQTPNISEQMPPKGNFVKVYGWWWDDLRILSNVFGPYTQVDAQ
jgi:hypothetical protein